jgi:hypothetical protein
VTVDGGQDAGSSPDAGPSRFVHVYECPDAPPSMELDGGWRLLPPERAARLSCIIGTCEKRVEQAQAKDRDLPPPLWFVGWAASLVLVAALAWLLPRP